MASANNPYKAGNLVTFGDGNDQIQFNGTLGFNSTTPIAKVSGY